MSGKDSNTDTKSEDIKQSRLHGLIDEFIKAEMFAEARGAVMVLCILNDEVSEPSAQKAYVENLAGLFMVEQLDKQKQIAVGNAVAKYLRIDLQPEAVKAAVELIKANQQSQEPANA